MEARTFRPGLHSRTGKDTMEPDNAPLDAPPLTPDRTQPLTAHRFSAALALFYLYGSACGSA